MADASALSLLLDGPTILSGPLDDASRFVFFRELFDYLNGSIKQFAIDLFGRSTAWVSLAASTFVTLWLLIEGFRIVIGRSQRSMTEFVIEMMRAVVITAFATGSYLGGSTLYDWVNHDLGHLIHLVLTGESGDVVESIDRSLGGMELGFSFIDEIQTGDDPVLERHKFRNLGFVLVGTAGPAVVAGTLLLMFKIMLGLCLGTAPLFVLSLLFERTKGLFWSWLNYLIGTLFALSILQVMAAIALEIVCALAATFWTAKLTGASVEGVNSMAMQQGGVGLLLTVLIVTSARMAAQFFKGTLGEFSAYSAFGNAGAGRASAGHGSHMHTQARAYADTGERPQAGVPMHEARVATSTRTAAHEERVKPAEDTRSFLERYPNATASLNGEHGRGDPIPASARSSAAYASGIGLGREVDALIEYSPTLQADIKELKNENWKFAYGDDPRSFVDRRSKEPRIVIGGNKRDDPEETLRSLVHEVGHAKFPYKADYSSRHAYVQGALADEASAVIKNIQIRREILVSSGGSIDIGLNANSSSHATYEAAYDQYLLDGNMKTALQKIGDAFGDETTQTADGRKLTYREYYGEHYDLWKK